MLRITYYKSSGVTAGSTIGSDIKDDQIDASLSFALPLRQISNMKPRLDFDGDLYGQGARVGFVARLRGEEWFDSVDALVEQMHRDVEATRAILRGAW